MGTATLSEIHPRLTNPAALVPGSFQAIQALIQSIEDGAPAAVLELVHLRASQLNGCAACLDYGWRSAKAAGEPDERLFLAAAWREAACFTPAERAALALTEAVTRLPVGSEPVPDAVWNEVAGHFDEAELARVVLMIGLTNFFNRINITTRQPAGSLGGPR